MKARGRKIDPIEPSLVPDRFDSSLRIGARCMATPESRSPQRAR